MKTHTGNVRANNEDACFIRLPVLAVADGMGGHVAGEVASTTAVEALGRCKFEQNKETDPRTQLRNAIRTAHQQIVQAAAADETLRGMGTTITAAFLTDDQVQIAHVGDSRAYMWRSGALRQLTSDHSLAHELVRAGELDEQDARHHPQRHVLTRAVSTGALPEPDMIMEEMLPGDTLLLCTDGLTVHVSDSEIGDVLRRTVDPQTAADELVRLALAGGGSDNVTVIVARGSLPEVIR